jgi:hypothetical protein
MSAPHETQRLLSGMTAFLAPHVEQTTEELFFKLLI